MQSREPITYVEIEQDFCQLSYGVAPCMAAVGVTGNTQCFNTLRTCQDVGNYRANPKTIRFTEAAQGAEGVEIGAWLVEGEFTAVAGDTGFRPLMVRIENTPWSYFDIAEPYFAEVGEHNLYSDNQQVLLGWNSVSGDNSFGVNVGSMVRVAGIAPDNNQNIEIKALNYVPALPGKTYVMRFLMRTDADFNDIRLSFFSSTNGHRRITPTITKAQKVSAIPSVTRVRTAPTVINPGGGGRRSGPLGQRASLSVTFQDHPSSDLQTDPYVNERGYNPIATGTFWTKWLARNPYYNNRIVRVRDGYIGQPLEEMVTRTYLIDRIVGPNSRGEVTLQAKDILRLADNDKALAPHPSPGELVSDYDENASGNIDVTGATTADYPASGTIRINREVFRYTGRAMSGSNLRFTGVTRATDGTERGSHKAGDMVQECLRYEQVRVEQLARDWLIDYAGVPSEYIPYADWQAEADLWLDQFDFTGLITEPTGVNQLLGEICEQALFYIWWDERAQLIRLQAIAPRIYEDVETIDDDKNIVADSVELKDDPASRVSQVWVFWGVRNATESLQRDDNYTRVRVRADLDAESKNQYDDSRIRKVYSRWIRTEGQAINLSTRILNKLRDNPRTMTIELDAKDRRFWTGDVVDVLTRYAVDFLGQPQADRWQVLSAEEIESGHRVRYELDLYEFGISGLHGRWMEVDAPSYNDASETERLSGAWWADENGRIPTDDGDVDGYQWI